MQENKLMPFFMEFSDARRTTPILINMNNVLAIKSVKDGKNEFAQFSMIEGGHITISMTYPDATKIIYARLESNEQ